MDKEAKEQIRVGVLGATDTNMTIEEAVDYIERQLEGLGYCKMGGELRLLSELEIHLAYCKGERITAGFYQTQGIRDGLRQVAQAQHDADMKFYGGL